MKDEDKILLASEQCCLARNAEISMEKMEWQGEIVARKKSSQK
jgi:hypothetical protein